MKAVPAELVDRLSAGAGKLCLCWILTRSDGVRLGATNHDRALMVDGVNCAPEAALSAVEFRSTAGLAPGFATADGAFDLSFLDEVDLAEGRLTGAKLNVYRVDWERPDLKVHVWAGRMSEVTQQGSAFHIELTSLKADLEGRIGRIYARKCDAALGDERCGLEVTSDQSCDKRFETCRDIFANSENFRGFPHLPGPDFVVSGPSGGGSDTGGRR